MGVLSWLRGEGLEQRAMSTLANPSPQLTDSLIGERTLSGESVSARNALAVADVFSAVNIIARGVSLCPFKVYRRQGEDVIEAADHRAYRMLHDRPNPFTAAHRFWATIAVHELLWGNWFIEELRGVDGLVDELRILDPASTTVEFDWVSGRKRFRVTRPDGTQDTLDEGRVLHGFGVSQDGLIGLSPIQQARESIGAAKGRVRFQADVYARRPFISGTIEHPRTIRDGGLKIREAWRAIYGSGSPDRHGVAVLEEGSHFNPITAPMADMQFVEQAQLSKTEIAVLFGLPPSSLGGSTGDSLTYATVEANRIQKATEAIAPVCNNIAQFVSQDVAIFPFQSWYAEFVLEGLMRGEPGARAAYWKTMDELGVVDAATIAARENLPPPPAPKPVPAPLAAVPDPAAAADPSAVSGTIAGNG